MIYNNQKKSFGIQARKKDQGPENFEAFFVFMKEGGFSGFGGLQVLFLLNSSSLTHH
jgi:hypothetical protein